MYLGSYKTFFLSKKVYASGKRQLRVKQTYLFRCESCSAVFTRTKRKLYVTHDMCSASCRKRETRSGGQLRAAAVNTFKARHGVDSVEHSKLVSKRRATCLAKFGVESPGFAPSVRAACVATSLRHYGTEHPMQSATLKASIDHAVITAKRHETMKRNGTYGKSRQEDKFFEQLVTKFGADDIARSVSVNGWSIDFFIKSIDTYVQFDGVYWHGLNRPLENIRSSTAPRDRVILKTHERDQEQNVWFAAHAMRLVRVTDKQFKGAKYCCDEFV